MFRPRCAQISQQLADIQIRPVDVEVRLRQIEREEQLPTHDEMLKQVEPRLVASIRAILTGHSANESLFPEVYEAIVPHVAEALGPHPGEGGQTRVLLYDTEHKEQNVDGAAAFILRCRVPDNGREIYLYNAMPIFLNDESHVTEIQYCVEKLWISEERLERKGRDDQ